MLKSVFRTFLLRFRASILGDEQSRLMLQVLNAKERDLLFGKWDFYNRPMDARRLPGIAKIGRRFRWEADGRPCPECIHEEGKYGDFVLGRGIDSVTSAWRTAYMLDISEKLLCDRHHKERLKETRAWVETFRKEVMEEDG